MKTKQKSKLAMDIKLRRVSLGMSQKELAEQLGVSTRTVWNWENDISSPTIKMWESIISISNG